jgi:hypothetical protein
MDLEQHRLAEHLKVVDLERQLADGLIRSLIVDARPIERILVVKTSSAGYVRVTLDRLGSLFPDAKLSVWTEERESEEFYLRRDVDRIVLYRNLGSIPSMMRDLAAIEPDLLVIQSTHEPTYAKMQFLAAILLTRSWLVYVYDERAEVRGALGIGPKVETVLGTFFAREQLIAMLFSGAFDFGLKLWRIVALPFVVAGLLVRAGRHSFTRFRYLRARSRPRDA